jgi:hypothetical protein
MKSKRFIILGLSIMLSLTMKAQEIREITLKKSGKLEKTIKEKERDGITKLKVIGLVNCEDITFISKLRNLKYLDLREIEFDAKNKHNHKDCIDNPTSFKIHNINGYPITINLAEFYAPLKGFDNLNNVNAMRIHIPYGMSFSGECPYLFVEGDANQAISDTFHISIREHSNAWTTVDNKSVATQVYNSSNSSVVVIKETGEFLVRKWPAKKISREELKKVSLLEEGAFGYGLDAVSLPDTIELSENLEKLPPNVFFRNKDRFNPLVIINNGLKEIGKGAFQLKKIKVPSSVEKFDGTSYLDTIEIESKTPPQWLHNIENSKTIFIIPDGTSKSYYAYNPNLNYIDLDPNGSYNINVPQGNSILSYITLEELLSADSLTITGILFEDDFKMLRKAKSLRYLDISNCVTDYSPETYEKMNTERQVVSAIFGAISQQLDNNYNDYKIGTTDYKVNKAIADYISEAYSKGKVEKKCLVPYEALEDMTQLTHIKLPILATSIGKNAFSGCKNLKTVELPPFLTVIASAAFFNCESLRNIEIPKTIKRIGACAFENCNSLTKVEFPAETIINEIEGRAFSSCNNLTEIILPEGLKDVQNPVSDSPNVKKIVIPSTCTKFRFSYRQHEQKPVPCELHFKCATPPEGHLSELTSEAPITLYVPKGTITKYMSKNYGKIKNYIEE